jgi:hypothetical protein
MMVLSPNRVREVFMVVFLCYCLAVFDYLYMPPCEANTPTEFNAVSATELWKFVKGYAFVITCDVTKMKRRDIEMLLGEPDSGFSTGSAVMTTYKKCNIILVYDCSVGKFVFCEAYRLRLCSLSPVSQTAR